jgi:hypothetical protein
LDQIVRDGAVVHKWLSKSRFSFFCDSFANSFIPRFRESILSLRAVSEVGAEQLLLDVAHVKTTLDNLPKLDKAKRKKNTKKMRLILLICFLFSNSLPIAFPRDTSASLQKRFKSWSVSSKPC